MKENKPKINNFVAKHAQRSGAGVHKPKQGKHVAREREKHETRRVVDSYQCWGYND